MAFCQALRRMSWEPYPHAYPSQADCFWPEWLSTVRREKLEGRSALGTRWMGGADPAALQWQQVQQLLAYWSHVQYESCLVSARVLECCFSRDSSRSSCI